MASQQQSLRSKFFGSQNHFIDNFPIKPVTKRDQPVQIGNLNTRNHEKSNHNLND